jgi:hypothetical protein
MAKPRPSEWGKLNAGQSYGILAVDLGRAIFGVPWGKYELPIIYYLIEHSWGVAKTKRRGAEWPDPEPCEVNFNALANEWGYPRQRLYEARDYLKATGFLIEDGNGYWINKNAHDWIDPKTGFPLLSPQMLIYAARARSRKDETDKQSSVTPQRDNVSHSSVTPHKEERARVLDFKTFETQEESQRSAARDDATPPYPDEDYPLEIGTGPHAIDEPGARRVWDRLWRAWHDQRLCNQFYARQRDHSTEAWLWAIEQAVLKGANPSSIAYLSRIADDYGRPRPAARPRAAPTPTGSGTIAERKARARAIFGGEDQGDQTNG